MLKNAVLRMRDMLVKRLSLKGKTGMLKTRTKEMFKKQQKITFVKKNKKTKGLLVKKDFEFKKRGKRRIKKIKNKQNSERLKSKKKIGAFRVQVLIAK